MKTARILIATALLMPAAVFAKEEAKGLTIEQVPAKAAAAIRAAAGNAKLEIEAEKEDGKDAFEAKWSAAGKKHEIVVAADGTVLVQEEEIAVGDAPAPVQAAIKALGGKLEKVEKETAKSVVTYEAEVETDKGELEVTFDATGKELSRETEKAEEKGEGKKDKDDAN